MAFEDRCSPQSAPSPPGIPHSPQNTASSAVPSHCHQYHSNNNNSSSSPQTILSSSLSDQRKSTTPTSTTPTNESDEMSTTNDRLSPPPVIKEEQTDININILNQHHYLNRRQENNITNDQQFHLHPLQQHHHQQQQQQQQQQLQHHPFSISSILSDNFGKLLKKKNEKKILFRPYDIISNCHSSNESINITSPISSPPPPAESPTPPSAVSMKSTKHLLDEIKLSKFRINHEMSIIDFSKTTPNSSSSLSSPPPSTTLPPPTPQSLHQSSQLISPTPLKSSSLVDNNASTNNKSHLLFNSINLQAYPKIHEEILNSKIAHRNHHHNHQFSTHQFHHQQFHSNSSQFSAASLSDSSFSKIPPLGNLCKTVSQIGQPLSSSTSSSSSSTSAALLSSMHHHHHHQQQQRSPSTASSTSSIGSSISGTPHKQDKQKHLNTNNNNNSHHQSDGGQYQNSNSGNNNSDLGMMQILNGSGRDSGMESSDDAKSETESTKDENGTQLWPAWVYCTRYSDRPSSGPRYRKPKQPKDKAQISDEKRPRTAFSSDQLARLKREFTENRYLTERRRQQLSSELGLNEAQIKIWFQNKRAKIKKTSGNKNPLALQLMAQGLYNHSTVPLTKEEEELEMRMNGQLQ